MNGTPIRFLVDTGATSIALPASFARRAGPRLPQGAARHVHTANGVVPRTATLDTVRLGDIELQSVDASCSRTGLDVALLGMSFLNRVEMKRGGDDDPDELLRGFENRFPARPDYRNEGTKRTGSTRFSS